MTVWERRKCDRNGADNPYSLHLFYRLHLLCRHHVLLDTKISTIDELSAILALAKLAGGIAIQVLLNSCLKHHGTHGYPSRLRDVLKFLVNLLRHTDFDLTFFELSTGLLG